MDKGGQDWGNGITPADFAGGSALFVFDLSPDKCTGSHFNLFKLERREAF